MIQQIAWENDFERAQERAAAEDKLILIDFFDPN